MVQEMVAIEDLHVAESNPRTQGVGDVRALAASIKAVGIIQPLVVTPTNGVLVGTRRLAAAKMAKLINVPVVRWAGEPAELQEVMLIENLQRQELHPLEEANAIAVLVALGRTQQEIAKRTGMSQSWVSYRLSLLDLPDKATKALYDGVINVDQARDLAKVAETPAIVEAVLERIAGGERNLSISQAVSAEQRLAELRAELEERKVALEGEGRKVLLYDSDDPIGGIHHLWQDDFEGHEECGAVLLSVGYNRIDEEIVCTDPDRHEDADDIRKPDRAKERAQAEAERKVLDAAREGRIAACQELCRRMPSKQTAELIESVIITAMLDDWNIQETATKILELQVPGPEDETAAEIDEVLDALVAYAERSDKARHHAALAIACGTVETSLDYRGPMSSAKLIALYYALIATVGYQPTEAELHRLEPEEAPAEVVG